ncbi:hypothetical protein CEE37_02715 [candidate division LCP-89 bacterium B3_LCP]|uniref:POTRA domain-containing protein n=1 Tax=candidate division LCP-89 bacterium B3_LCP TaxID=2012998 RepID=A0A532V2Y3_UNCL8|nr:MAG: hypothetical protein CEE37_02715 [candidate division LCP-89 bacterium B3_LCP]
MVSLVVIVGWFLSPNVLQYLSQQECFKLEEVCFTGNEHIEETDLLSLLPEVIGINLFSLDLNIIKHAVLQHPWVLEASVHRRLPDRLLIRVEEKQPVALVKLKTLQAISASGDLLPLDKWHGAIDLPLIQAAKFQNSLKDDKINNRRLMDITRSVAALKKRIPDLWLLISEITLDRKGRIVMYPSCSHTCILVGDELGWQQMRDFYSFIIFQGSPNGMVDISFVDLRFRGKVIVRRTSSDT